MSTAIAKPETVKREVGERVDIFCNLETSTVKDLGDGVFEAVITTSDVDRQNESIVTSGIDTKTWIEKNPVVTYGHDYSGLPIGKGLSLTTLKNKIKSRFQLAVQEYPFAATVAAMIKGGYINSTSIGGVVKKWSEDYRTIEEMEMVEFAVVPIPANANAVITSRSLEEMTGKSITTIKTEFEDFSRKVLLDKVKGMHDDEVNDAVKVLKNLLARLEESTTIRSSADDNEVKRVKHIVLRDAQAVATQATRVIRTIKLKGE